MRKPFLLLTIVALSFSCGNSDKNVQTSIAKDTAVIPPPDMTSQHEVATGTVQTVKLTFTGYEEGDYAHLLFTETGNTTEYDFGHPDDNSLNNIPVVVKDPNAAFGYKENNKLKGAKFVAEIVYKMSDTYDGNGQPIKGNQWRISHLKKDE